MVVVLSEVIVVVLAPVLIVVLRVVEGVVLSEIVEVLVKCGHWRPPSLTNIVLLLSKLVS